ncbi:regulatory peptide helical complex [Caudoviricetes sp.]|nr:regulatory peptide helical complex [Caudoviricetes sp.]
MHGIAHDPIGWVILVFGLIVLAFGVWTISRRP